MIMFLYPSAYLNSSASVHIVLSNDNFSLLKVTQIWMFKFPTVGNTKMVDEQN
jgi:hypothetical protein